MRLIVIIFLLSVFAKNGLTQRVNYRLKADFSMKETAPNGKYHLFMGTVYYNPNKAQLLYDLKFPMEQKWLVTDSVTYLIRGDSISDKRELPGFVQQSLFYLIINGDLKNFGLSNTFLNLDKVEKKGDQVISTWKTAKPTDLFNGEILTSVKNNQLFGVVYKNDKNEILSKQFYEDYEVIDGTSVPLKTVNFTYKEGIEFCRIMTLRSVKFNEEGNDEMYNYRIN